MPLNKFQVDKDQEHQSLNHNRKTKKMKILLVLKRRRDMVKFQSIFRDLINKKKKNLQGKLKKKKMQKLLQVPEECPKMKDKQC